MNFLVWWLAIVMHVAHMTSSSDRKNNKESFTISQGVFEQRMSLHSRKYWNNLSLKRIHKARRRNATCMGRFWYYINFSFARDVVIVVTRFFYKNNFIRTGGLDLDLENSGFVLNSIKLPVFRGECSVNTDYLKVPIFPDFVDNFPDFCNDFACARRLTL